MLQGKSFTQKRAIAQALGIADIFSMDEIKLDQAILLKQEAIAPKPQETVPVPPYDARLMTKAPSRRTNRTEVEEILSPYVQRGLHLRFDEERWYIQHGIKTDEGSLRMPLRNIVICCEKVMK